MREKTIIFGDAVITLKRLTYGARIDMLEMNAKFTPALPSEATDADRMRYAARRNFISAGVYTSSVHGLNIELPHPSDAHDAFDRKLAGFFGIDNELVALWLEGIVDISKSMADTATLPPDAQTEAERKDPN